MKHALPRLLAVVGYQPIVIEPELARDRGGARPRRERLKDGISIREKTWRETIPQVTSSETLG